MPHSLTVAVILALSWYAVCCSQEQFETEHPLRGHGNRDTDPFFLEFSDVEEPTLGTISSHIYLL